MHVGIIYHFKDFNERLKALDLPTLAFRRLRGDMIEIFKHLNTYDNCTISSTFVRKTHPSRTNSFQLHDPVAKGGNHGTQKKSFYFRNINVWNKLPNWVVESKDVNAFKNQLDEFWKDNPLKFDYQLSSD